jgi:GT2 family glycosyltransferase
MNASPNSLISRLSVSIVLHNSSLPLLLGTLRSLRCAVEVARDSGYLDDVSVWLVDNASSESYRASLQYELARFPELEFFHVHYSPHFHNRGFGHGHNTVLPLTNSDLHLILNPDVELAEDALHAGLTAMQQHPDIALLSPRVVGGEGDQEFLCKSYPSVLVLLLRGFAPGFLRRWFRRQLSAYEMRELCSGDRPVEVAIASGCFMLIRTTALRAVAGFNEDFFLYFEDFDLSLRLAREGRLFFDPAIRIVHHGGYAASKGFLHVRYFIRSGIRFFNRHGWRWA